MSEATVKLCLACKHVEMGDHLRDMYKQTSITPHGSNLRCGRTQDVLVGDTVFCSQERANMSPPRYPNPIGDQCGPEGVFWIAADE